ncbi:NAD(P)/FAD-dependent oxidoreductase, partial [Actinoalloteichus caeruleus]
MAHGAKNGGSRPRIVIVGGGYVGLNTALRLESRLRHSEASVVVIDQQPHMTYQPFLPEVAAASVEPRHVIAPLRSMLRRCEVITGRVGGIDHHRRTVTVTDGDGATEEVDYDILAVAPGSISRILPIPGLVEQGIGFKTVSEAIYLRNHVLSRLDAAASATDTARRRRLLTF